MNSCFFFLCCSEFPVFVLITLLYFSTKNFHSLCVIRWSVVVFSPTAMTVLFWKLVRRVGDISLAFSRRTSQEICCNYSLIAHKIGNFPWKKWCIQLFLSLLETVIVLSALQLTNFTFFFILFKFYFVHLHSCAFHMFIFISRAFMLRKMRSVYVLPLMLCLASTCFTAEKAPGKRHLFPNVYLCTRMGWQ